MSFLNRFYNRESRKATFVPQAQTPILGDLPSSNTVFNDRECIIIDYKGTTVHKYEKGIEYYDSTKVVVDKRNPMIINRHNIYKCYVSWYERNQDFLDAKNGKRYIMVWAEIDTNLLSRTDSKTSSLYRKEVVSELLAKERVINKYILPEFFPELQKRVQPLSGLYVGGVNTTNPGERLVAPEAVDAVKRSEESAIIKMILIDAQNNAIRGNKDEKTAIIEALESYATPKVAEICREGVQTL